MRITKIHEDGNTKIHEGREDPRRRKKALWAFLSSWAFVSSWIFVFPSSWIFVFAQTSLPPGALSLVSEDRHGSLVALCADTGEPVIQQGAKQIRATGVWVGERSNLRRVQAGVGACDPAWSPDGRFLALTSAEGLWVLPAKALAASLRAEAKLPLGESMEYTYRAFSKPQWSPDGALVALLVTNGGTSRVEVFDASTGRLFYTSPPENYSFSWAGGGRELKLGSTEIRLPSRIR